MSENPDDQKLKALGERLDKARAEENRTAKADRRKSNSELGKAYRMAIELVVAIVVGGGVGWYLDVWLGTRPWLFIIFFFLGVAAGFRNVYKAAQMMGNQGSSKDDDRG